ncbi:MAG: response regulator transcription factor [Flavobacteriales bacterium]|nr:response regulator transcription factor [Flavobacteriales bacterium]
MEHKVAMVDDHHLVRNGLVATVNSLGGYKVTMEAAHGRELLEALEAADVEVPRIAIVDLNMPVMDGYETIEWLRANRPQVLPLALTFDATDEALLKAVRLGARGFLLKNARPEVLKNALDSLISSNFYYSDRMLETMKEHPELRTRQEVERERVMELVTPRELEFLQLVCSPEEMTYEEIGNIMGVHRRSVDNYRIGLFEKLGVKSKTGLVLFAMRWGLLSTDHP